MRIYSHVILAVALASVTLPATAHRAAAVYYDLTNEVTMTGTVTEFRMGNPHARIYFDIAVADGSVTHWMAEGGSRTVMLRRGWTGDEVKVGDLVTLHGHRARDGGNYIHMTNVDLPDGTRKFAEDADPESVRTLLEQRRRRDRR